MSPTFLEFMDELRTRCGFALKINSGFRCLSHNAKIGSKFPNSQHTLGLAADVSTKNLTALQKITLAKHAFSLGVRGFGVYPTFFHLDLRFTQPSLWTKIK